MYENINIETDNCCYVDGHFYIIDIELGALIAKSAGGTILFSYPIFKQIPSAPLKLDYDGVYFFSLHLESNRNIIRKWRLVNYSLDFITEFDYSSVGVLASRTSVFNKYFSRPILHGDWLEDNPTGGSFEIVYNELVVADYGPNIGAYHGPSITKTFPDIHDFKFNLKFKFGEATQNFTRLALQFNNDDGQVYLLWIYATWCRLYDVTANVTGNAALDVIEHSYNYVEITRHDEQIEFSLNGYNIYTGDTNDLNINNFNLGIQVYYVYTPEYFAINSLSLSGYTSTHKIDTNTLVIDSYKASLAETLPIGSDYIKLEGSYEHIEPGTLLYLGDPDKASYEEVTVTGTISEGMYGLNFYTYFNHDISDPVSYSKNFYLFNNFQRKTEAGSIYKLNYKTGYLEEMFDSDNYLNISAACFFHAFGTYLCGYVHLTNFVTLDLHNDMILFDVMNIENVKTDDVSVITVHDAEVHDGSLYRLQQEANYYGEDYIWSNYNYQLTPIRPFIDSTTIQAVPVIMNADGISTVEVTTLAKDQYAKELQFIRVKFDDDDDVGYMTIQDTYTGITGKAVSYYRSGVEPRKVTLYTEIIQEV